MPTVQSFSKAAVAAAKAAESMPRKGAKAMAPASGLSRVQVAVGQTAPASSALNRVHTISGASSTSQDALDSASMYSGMKDAVDNSVTNQSAADEKAYRSKMGFTS